MLEIEICGVKFKNPVIAASGTFGFGAEYNNFYDVGLLGGISSKGLTINPKAGNDGLRVYETASGMMNSIGLNNPGIDHFIAEELPLMQSFGTNILVNVGGASFEDYAAAIEKVNDTAAHFIELNISCPNVKHGGMAYGIKADIAKQFVSEIKPYSKKPLMVKLSPNAENIVDMALACEEAGADALSLVNTFKAMAIDIKAKRSVFNNTYAGLSGPAIKPIALRMVHEVAHAVKIPVVGLGGIASTQDAIEFLMVGASAIQIGTANFINPRLGLEIINGLEDYCKKEGLKSITEIIGCI